MYVQAKEQFQNVHKSTESKRSHFWVVLSLFIKVRPGSQPIISNSVSIPCEWDPLFKEAWGTSKIP